MLEFTNAYKLTYDVSREQNPFYCTTTAVRLTDLTNGASIVVLKANTDDRSNKEWQREMLEHVLAPAAKAGYVYMTEKYVHLEDDTVWYFNIFNKFNKAN